MLKAQIDAKEKEVIAKGEEVHDLTLSCYTHVNMIELLKAGVDKDQELAAKEAELTEMQSKLDEAKEQYEKDNALKT